MAVQMKRIYEDKSADDGKRILVDRIWPRGISKDDADLDEWFKEVAPSKELRQWFNHEEGKFPEFKKKYRKELQDGSQKKAYDQLKEIQKNNEVITLLYGSKNEIHNQAVVLKEMLEGN